MDKTKKSMAKLYYNLRHNCYGFQVLRLMRRIFAVFIFLLSTSANAQWNIQSAIPTHLDVTNVSSPATGKVFNATNGDSWFPNSSGTTELLNDVDYFSNGDLIAVGTNGTVLTNTGGGS